MGKRIDVMPRLNPAPTSSALHGLCGRLSPDRRSELESRVRKARTTGTPFSILLIRSKHDPSGWLESGAEVTPIDERTFVVALGRCHIDRACAVAERLVRRSEDREVRVGVAQLLPGCRGLEPLMQRAEEALKEAVDGTIGPVASMNWADVSQDLTSSYG